MSHEQCIMNDLCNGQEICSGESKEVQHIKATVRIQNMIYFAMNFTEKDLVTNQK